MFDFGKASATDSGVESFLATENAVLLDVRTEEEFRGGRIPKAVNLPLDRIGEAESLFPKDTAVFVYCRSGARSARAAAALKSMGYAEVKNIGGIMSYHGEVES